MMKTTLFLVIQSFLLMGAATDSTSPSSSLIVEDKTDPDERIFFQRHILQRDCLFEMSRVIKQPRRA